MIRRREAVHLQKSQMLLIFLLKNDTETGTDDGSVEPDNNEYHQDFSAYELRKGCLIHRSMS